MQLSYVLSSEKHLMENYQKSKIWKRTLEKQHNDEFEKERELLRVEFENFRKNAKLLAAEISKDLPDFTIHDITHIDALWDTADLILSDDYPINPAEAFVLGSAFLIHDLGLALASYPNGISELKKEQLWRDTIASIIRSKYDRVANENDFESPETEIMKDVTALVLRSMHAKNAERLANTYWMDKNNHQLFLLEQNELRDAYGSIIGLIAHSHWWPVEELDKKLPQSFGAIGNFPNDWSIDAQKLACILRITDAVQIDERRANKFSWIFRKPNESSDLHWNFQQKLLKPILEHNRIKFTSKNPFTIEEAESWWLCYDTLQMIDRELKEVDSFLKSTGKQCFNADGVSSIEDPDRLKNYITVNEWQPVDTRIKVSNIAKLVENLGGEQLYGKNLTVPLRELIQNAADAVRARRVIDNKPEDFGDVTIRIGREENEDFLEIEDNGIGMSQKVLTGPFLDFGQKFWGTQLMHEELPGLESKGFESTGQFGIGFYSVFMLNGKVRITTRRFDKGRNETLVLEFNKGSYSRPVLRKAKKNEEIADGGNKVRIWVNISIINQILSYNDVVSKTEFIERFCPSMDCNIILDENGKKTEVIKSNDWLTIEPINLMMRINGKKVFSELDKRDKELFKQLLNNMKIIKEDDGRIVGRLFLFRRINGMKGLITIGGMNSIELDGINGILLGKPLSIVRDQGIPIASANIMKEFATRQANLLSSFKLDFKYSIVCSMIINRFNGDTSNLKVCYHKNKSYSLNEIKNVILKNNSEEFIITDFDFGHDFRHNSYLLDYRKIKLYDNVFLTYSFPFYPLFEPISYKSHNFFISAFEKIYGSHSLLMLLLNAISESWKIDIQNLEVISTLFPSPIKGLNWTIKDGFEMEVGKYRGKTITSRCILVKKPKK